MSNRIGKSKPMHMALRVVRLLVLALTLASLSSCNQSLENLPPSTERWNKAWRQKHEKVICSIDEPLRFAELLTTDQYLQPIVDRLPEIMPERALALLGVAPTDKATVAIRTSWGKEVAIHRDELIDLVHYIARQDADGNPQLPEPYHGERPYKLNHVVMRDKMRLLLEERKILETVEDGKLRATEKIKGRKVGILKKPVKAECRYLVMVRASFDHDDHSRVWIQAKLVERATDRHKWTRWYAPSKERGKVQDLFKLIDDRVSHNTTNKE